MAIESGFFNDVYYTADTFNTMISGLIGDGASASIAECFQVKQHANMTCVIRPGFLWFPSGRFTKNTSDLNMVFDAADGSLHRIDRVVVRENLSDNTTGVIIVKGLLSDNPVAPDLVRNGTNYDKGLATVYITAGTTSITQDMITDTRGDSDVCGYVYGVGQKINTTGVFAQYEAEWLKLKNIMSAEDPVAALLIRIETLDKNCSDKIKKMSLGGI